MSYEVTWSLPEQELDRERVTGVLQKILSRHPGMKLGPALDPEFEEFADDFDEYDDGDSTIELRIGVLRKHLEAAHDSPQSEPDEAGTWWGLIAVMPASEDGPPQLTVHSNDEQNRSCWMTMGGLAGELSVALGGSDEPDES